MMSSRLSILFLFLTTVGSAQVTGTVGPPSAPIGCPIDISISNDTNSEIFTGVCPFQVRDAVGQIVYTPFCIAIVVTIPAGQTWSTQWNQIDSSGVQLPAGAYSVDLFLPAGAGTVNVPVTLGGVAAAVAPLGTMKIGRTRGLSLCAPLDGGYAFVAAASAATAPGITSCGGTIGLAPDAVFQLSLDPANPIFLNFSGVLDAQGRSTGPLVAVPNDPAIVGLGVVVAFVVIDPTAACVIRRVSASTVLPIF